MAFNPSNIVDLIENDKIPLSYVANNIKRRILLDVLMNLWANAPLHPHLLRLIDMYKVKLPALFRTDGFIWETLVKIDESAVYRCIYKYKIDKEIFLECFYKEKIYFSKYADLNNLLVVYRDLCIHLKRFDYSFMKFKSLSLKERNKIINDSEQNTHSKMLRDALHIYKSLRLRSKHYSSTNLFERYIKKLY